MSYDVSLLDSDHKIIVLPEKHYFTGTIVELDSDGSDLADIGITYNYSRFFYDVIHAEKGLRFIDGLSGRVAAPILLHGILALTLDRDPNYWEPTAGNARHALEALLWFALQAPTGVFEVR